MASDSASVFVGFLILFVFLWVGAEKSSCSSSFAMVLRLLFCYFFFMDDNEEG
jgi:hypothetical protein